MNKISVKKDVHTGNQPIRVLKHNITTRLVERNEQYIKELFSDGRLYEGINYSIEVLPLIERQLPFIDARGIINIHETFLSYLWGICYSFFVIHEEDVAIPDLTRRGMTVHKEPNPELLSGATELLNYVRSLIKTFSAWDITNLPNPEFYDADSPEGWYVVRANDLFVETMNFIVYHEMAHAEFGHVGMIIDGSLENEERKKLEIEADTRAIELLFSNTRSKMLSELAIITGIGSILFIKNNVGGGPKHPDIDKRLENAIEKFNPEEDNQIWTMLVLILKSWDAQFVLGLRNQGHYHSFRDLYYDLISQAPRSVSR